ncbi:MAG: hypothetical protein MI923_20365 [Phycisphaerales bacterium]|nr:hypothetical protein [Phycisphaerales bacterium]
MNYADEIFQEFAAPVIKEVAGEQVTLKGDCQNDLTVTALSVSPVRGNEREHGDETDAELMVEVSFNAADIGDPGDWSTVVINEEEWHIDEAVALQTSSVVVIRARQTVAVEKTRPGLRNRR